MSAVGKAFKSIFGGGTQPSQGAAYQPMSGSEQDRLNGIESSIGNLFGQQSGQANGAQLGANDLTSLFQGHLKDFLTQGPNVTPDQLKSASDFVDQTFTNPTQTLVNQANDKFQADAQAKAAAMGRSPNTDVQLNQAVNSNQLQNAAALGAERGSRIQNATTDIYNRGLSSLNAGLQGSGFLNNLAQQAYQNQLGLLNARTGLADFYQKNRANMNTTLQPTAGFLGAVSGGANQLLGTAGAIGGLKNLGGAFSGPAGGAVSLAGDLASIG